MRVISLLLIFSFFVGFSPRAEAVNINQVSAEACVLMYEDGSCVFEKNADDRHLIASTTKIMTAIVCLENADLSSRVKIKREHCQVEGSSMYLKVGECYTVKELLLGLLLASGNDAALALADHVAGSEKEFAALMNETAKRAGMTDSSFANPHGLDARGHYSTARDMGRLMLYCMNNPKFCELISCYSTTIKEETYINHNKLLKQYPWCIGGKTGFTVAAGRCLVSCAEKNGMRFVCVSFAAPDDWNDHIKLYEYAFDNYCLKNISKEIVFEVPLISGNKKKIKLVPEEELVLFVNKADEIKIKAEIPIFIFAPVKIGETAGKFCVIINSNVVAECPLVYYEGAVIAYPCLGQAEMEVLLSARENTETDFCSRADVQKSC